MVANSHIKFKYSVYPYNEIASLLTEIFDRVYKCSILLNIVIRLKEKLLQQRSAKRIFLH